MLFGGVMQKVMGLRKCAYIYRNNGDRHRSGNKQLFLSLEIGLKVLSSIHRR